MEVEHVAVETPIGTLDLVIGPKGVQVLSFPHEWSGAARDGVSVVKRPTTPRSKEIVAHLKAYFSGDRDALERIPVDPEGTEFQLRVWNALRKVRRGGTVSYAELAKRAGSPSAVRAVALCNARNPVALAIPCHRVIGSDGSLTGYGGGLDRKRWLLEHEGALLPSGFPEGARRPAGRGRILTSTAEGKTMRKGQRVLLLLAAALVTSYAAVSLAWSIKLPKCSVAEDHRQDVLRRVVPHLHGALQNRRPTPRSTSAPAPESTVRRRPPSAPRST